MSMKMKTKNAFRHTNIKTVNDRLLVLQMLNYSQD